MRHELTVSKNGSGNFTTITEAINAVPYGEPGIIHIENGIYGEKLFIEKRNLTLIGEDEEKTVITYHDGAYKTHADGRSYGTFRSYTVFLSGGRLELQNLTIENSAGDGALAGQAIALYTDADFARFEQVRLLGHQDTLFLAPLPEQPRVPGSFIGPRENTPREACSDYFENCYIEGDTDFIFGGATAAFHNCEIRSLNRGKAVNGYITAACTPKEQKFGFIFYQCRLTSDCGPKTVFFGRPWRENACVDFLDCWMDAHIHPQGWSLWETRVEDCPTVRFTETGSSGPGAYGKRALWATDKNSQQQNETIKKVRELSCL